MNLAKRTLKLSLSLILVLILGLGLSACGGPGATLTPPAPTTSPVPTTAIATAQPTATLAPTVGLTAPPLGTTTAPLSVGLTPTVLALTRPGQPSSGPGGTSNYLHQTALQSVYDTGENQYYIFEPANPAPKSAPLIILMHGYGDIAPDRFRLWIEHLVKRGNLVVYPIYQQAIFSSGENFTNSAAKAIRNALEQLKNGKVTPELDKVSYFGYSAGGIITANLVAQTESLGLPAPKSLFLMTPGGSLGYGLVSGNGQKLEIPGFKLETADRLAKIPPGTKMVVVVADRDTTVGDIAAKFIWQSSSQVADTNRAFVRFNTDTHGKPPLIADHGIANRAQPDALNFFGMWKLFDALQSCALSGKDCEVALGDTAAQRFMGKWSDGQPVKELTIEKNP